VYEIVAVPVVLALAVTTPVDPTTLATMLLMLHVPPEVASLNVVDAPWHNDILPLMAVERPLTVTTNVLIQPVVVV